MAKFSKNPFTLPFIVTGRAQATEKSSSKTKQRRIDLTIPTNHIQKKTPRRIIYTCGAGNLIGAHKHWRNGLQDPTQVSVTFSSQVADFCTETGACVYAISSNQNAGCLLDGKFTICHLPKNSKKYKGIFYYFAEAIYTFKILIRAHQFKADTAVLESGSMPFFMQSLFSLTGIRVVSVLHNTLWPAGYPPKELGRRISLKLDSLFFRWCPIAVIGVSPECTQQVKQVTGPHHPPLYQLRAQFDPDYFRQIPEPPAHNASPFRVLFIGRIVEEKGVFDILEIARKLNLIAPDRVKWEICGTGPDVEELKRRCADLGLQESVNLNGWVSLSELKDIYAKCHAAIVPTRSGFDEGMAMTAVEAVLARRPVISNPIVPAATVLGTAVSIAQSEDIGSYVSCVLDLVQDKALYETRRAACKTAANECLDKSMSYSEVLKRVFSDHQDG